MKEKELKDILRRDFNFDENWKPLFSMLFSKVQYFSNPSNPFSESAKVVSGKQTGVVKLDDGKQLAIFEVEVDDSIRIDKNRQGLREIAIKHIDQNITHGAFVFFYSKYQKDYRFSFIARWSELDLETGEFRKGETKPKRYTYLLGDNEACTTAAKRLLMLAAKRDNHEIGIKDIIDTFSVESLNKEFFKTYKEHYERFWRFIANTDSGYREILLDEDESKKEVDREKPIRDFAKKLLGRIVFLHFLQKKGWMGCDAKTTKWENGEKQFMQLLFSDFSDKAHFHSKCLTKLFFNTLNTRRSNDIFEIAGLTGKLNGSRVPYLNGGLFDTDKPEAVLTIDFPEKYFAELLDFFEQYNFTIDENSPDDHEVGIDPEMLGHIFENLLEENREKGAFYTPKEVVQYMCKESLIQYLNNSFDESVNVPLFIRNHIVSEKLAIKDNAVLLNELLDNIKVCDPAIGSGAFPIGILQEIFEAKKFIYPYLKTNKEFNPAQVKKDIIQKSIYGVDLEKGAVDIAQLRFWLALVVDEEKPHPLPNLDYKIMQGNSLLESFEGIDLSKAALFDEPKVTVYMPSLFEEPKSNYGFSDENKADIKKLVNDYFIIEDKDQKAAIRKRIDRIVLDHIDKSLEFYENRLLIEIADWESRLESKIERLNDAQKEQYKAKSKELKEIVKRQLQLDNRSEARKKLLAFEHTDERPYFLWHLFFMDVFEKGGFDVIIGNPPYIQLQKMGKNADILQDAGFKTFLRTGDIYCLFYEKGIDILKDCGALTYITSNKWMRAGYGAPLRNLFYKRNPLKVIDLGSGVFHSATVDTNILIIQNDKNKNSLKGLRIKNEKINRINDTEFLKIEISNDNNWLVLDKEDYQIKLSIEKDSCFLKDFEAIFYRGLTTGFNDAFVIDEDTKDLLISEDPNCLKIIKPVIRGKNINKFSITQNNEYLINTHNGLKEKRIERIKVESYPSILKHLQKYDLILQKRLDKGDTHYNLRNCAYILEFEKEKIVFTKASKRENFAFDDKGYYLLNTSYFLRANKLKYLLVFFNSRLFSYCFNKFYQSGGIEGEITLQTLETIPLKKIESTIVFEILADYLILLNDPTTPSIMEHASNEMISQQLEEVLNMMVYELYFEDHMKEKEIDVLQFVSFPDISKMQNFEEKQAAIQKIYYWLKEKDNPIRNRILVSATRSPNIIKRINETTH
ncbi:MAG: TaqI-like C-terminal specificity domain-containing protein [Acutalibacteraceae bacterium]